MNDFPGIYDTIVGSVYVYVYMNDFPGIYDTISGSVCIYIYRVPSDKRSQKTKERSTRRLFTRKIDCHVRPLSVAMSNYQRVSQKTGSNWIFGQWK